MLSGLPALDDIGFEYPDRGVFLVMGPTGSGKTRLFHLMQEQCLADYGPSSCLVIDAAHPGVQTCNARLVVLDDFHYAWSRQALAELLKVARSAASPFCMGFALPTSHDSTVRADIIREMDVVLSLRHEGQCMGVTVTKNRDGRTGQGALLSYASTPPLGFWDLLSSEIF